MTEEYNLLEINMFGQNWVSQLVETHLEIKHSFKDAMNSLLVVVCLDSETVKLNVLIAKNQFNSGILLTQKFHSGFIITVKTLNKVCSDQLCTNAQKQKIHKSCSYFNLKMILVIYLSAWS